MRFTLVVNILGALLNGALYVVFGRIGNLICAFVSIFISVLLICVSRTLKRNRDRLHKLQAELPERGAATIMGPYKPSGPSTVITRLRWRVSRKGQGQDRMG